MKIAFVGDTHYCRAREGGRSGCTCATVLDHVRYTPMTESVLAPLFARVRELAPDLVICSGDIVEGGLRSEPVEEALEFREVLALFDGLDCPYLIARGTHDAPTPFLELAVPAMERAADASFGQAYFRHNVGDCAFLILDYQTLKEGNAQDAWLEEQLGEAAATGRRIFVTGHAPVVLWGRHFFGDPPLIRRLDALFSTYPVEAYLCGHTHNQALSFHARQGDRGWVQLMASSVGYPIMAPLPLEQAHCLADFGSRDTFSWGILEDSAPGFYILDLGAEGLAGSWESVGGAHHEFSAKDRRTAPSVSNWEPSPACSLREEDVHQIQAASIQVFGYSKAGSGGELFLNGVPLGAIPPNGAYAARRFVPLSNEALATISLSNTLIMRVPSTGEFAIGSFSLEVRLIDGRTCRTAPVAEIFVGGDRWFDFPGKRGMILCEAGTTVSLEIGWPLHRRMS